MDEICHQKGVEHALDNIGDSFDSVASRIAHWLHDGWGHSYPAGHRCHRVNSPTYSGTKNIVAIWTLAGEGEVFGKAWLRERQECDLGCKGNGKQAKFCRTEFLGPRLLRIHGRPG